MVGKSSAVPLAMKKTFVGYTEWAQLKCNIGGYRAINHKTINLFFCHLSSARI